MSRVTRTLATVTIATGIAAASFLPATTASATVQGHNDGLVNIEVNGNTIDTNLTIVNAVNVCGLLNDINVLAVDKGTITSTKCLALAGGQVVDNK
jgi:hypothetical protein